MHLSLRCRRRGNWQCTLRGDQKREASAGYAEQLCKCEHFGIKLGTTDGRRFLFVRAALSGNLVGRAREAGRLEEKRGLLLPRSCPRLLQVSGGGGHGKVVDQHNCQKWVNFLAELQVVLSACPMFALAGSCVTGATCAPRPTGAAKFSCRGVGT